MDWTLPPLWWLSPSPTLIKTLPLHCVRVFLFACFFHLDLAFIIFNYLLCKQNCLSTLISLHIKRFIRCFNTNFLICTKLLLHQSSKINMVQFIRAKLKAAAFTLCHYYSQLKRVFSVAMNSWTRAFDVPRTEVTAQRWFSRAKMVWALHLR